MNKAKALTAEWAAALAALCLLGACASKPLPQPATLPMADPGAEAVVLVADPTEASRIRRTLRNSRFGRVEVLTEPGDIPARLAEVLSRPGRPGDRRLVWVNDGSGRSCPSGALEPRPPAVATLLLGPACLSRMMRAEASVRHYEARPESVPGTTPAGTPLAFLALPGDDAGAKAAGTVLLAALSGDAATPAGLLEALRSADIPGGYAPRLIVSPPDAVSFAGFLASAEGE
jgi:hypothetical protein